MRLIGGIGGFGLAARIYRIVGDRPNAPELCGV